MKRIIFFFMTLLVISCDNDYKLQEAPLTKEY